jgi:hypothetical protein
VNAAFDGPGAKEASPRLTEALNLLADVRDELWRSEPDLEALRRDVVAAIAIVMVERWGHKDRVAA